MWEVLVWTIQIQFSILQQIYNAVINFKQNIVNLHLTHLTSYFQKGCWDFDLECGCIGEILRVVMLFSEEEAKKKEARNITVTLCMSLSDKMTTKYYEIFRNSN